MFAESAHPLNGDSALSVLGTFGPEGAGVCEHCEQIAAFVYLEDARRQARGVCSRCGADWWL